jgi:CTP synthase
MVSYLPTPSKVGEMKTKPTQHAVRTLNATGIQPDVIIARSEYELDKKRKDKIALHCNIKKDNVISAPDVDSIYDIPLNFERDHLGNILVNTLGLEKRAKKPNLSKWKKFVKSVKNEGDEVNIAIVGKYFDTGDFVLTDAYISVIEAIKFAAYKLGKRPKISWLNAVDFEDKKQCQKLKKYDGILVPGGFGERGIEGKVNVIEFARRNKVPYFGICYGMQLLVVEFARNVLGLKNANTVEIDPSTPEPVIDIMPDQRKKLEKKDYGGSMRLGSYPAVLKKGTIARRAYKKDEVEERHRHRYEVNPLYVERLKEEGLVFSGTSPNGVLMEIAELPEGGHPFFVGVQFHPEFHSSPYEPHPIFTEFVRAGGERAKGRK